MVWSRKKQLASMPPAHWVSSWRRKPRFLGTRIIMLLLLFSLLIHAVQSALPCGSNTTFCEEQLRPGSICDPNGFCTNPFASGCLRSILGEEEASQYTAHLKRVCNSDDDIDDRTSTTNNTICSLSEFDYPEIRIAYGNWESSMFISWIFQILLSEILGVPTTIETTPSDPSSTYRRGLGSFYDLETDFTYASLTYGWEGFHQARDLDQGDCRLARTTNNNNNNNDSDDENEYKPCTHLIPEIWPGQQAVWDQMENSGSILPVSSIDVVGRLGVFIPRFTAEEDLSFTSYLGLSRPENRQKVAQAFRKPTTWADYCRLISPNNCTIPDQVALRPPAVPDEEDRYFAPSGLYRGYFRATPQHDCQRFPNNCTGSFVDGPCDWSTWSQAQLHWNQIPLTSNGPNDHHGSYAYADMVDIWHAANETKTNVMMWWWSTDWMMQEFAGTSAEFIKVNFPLPTLKCSQSRVTDVGRCSANPMHRHGIEEGSCDYEPSVLRKAISPTLVTSQEYVPEAYKSAALDLIEDISLSDVVVDYLMKEWVNRNVDRHGYDGRDVVCTWIADNIQDLKDIVPLGYPRQIQVDLDLYKSVPYIIARIFATLALLCSLVAAIITVHWRERKVIRYAQPDFLYIILAGFILLSIASLLYTIEPQTLMCITRQWLVALGYSMELLPLIVKVHAILNAIRRARVFRRVKMLRSSLYGVLALFLSVVVLYMLVWTFVDAPQRRHQLHLNPGEYDENGRQLLDKSINCVSKSNAWPLVMLGWQFLLLFCASVLAVETRNIRSDFNESQFLGMMIYTHFMFVLLRLLVEIFIVDSLPSYSNILNSLFLSVDTLIAIGIYFSPKFYTVLYIDGDISPSFKSQQDSSRHGTKSGMARQSWISGYSMQESRAIMFDESNTGRSQNEFDNYRADDSRVKTVDCQVNRGVVLQVNGGDHDNDDNIDLSCSGRILDESQQLLSERKEEDGKNMMDGRIESNNDSNDTNDSPDTITNFDELVVLKDHNTKYTNDDMEQGQESAIVNNTRTAECDKDRLTSSQTSSTSSLMRTTTSSNGTQVTSALAGNRKRSSSASKHRVSFSNLEIDLNSIASQDSDDQ